MTYDEALGFIHSRRHGGPDLERMRRILERLGSPERGLRFVHVAGTNGKGSVCAYMAEIMEKAGYRTGLFTSPFVRRFNERIRIDGEDIPDGNLAEVTGDVRRALGEYTDAVAEFELVTIIGLTYFMRMGCDIAVLEVGMGGVRDATNVIPESEIAIITAIGLDHTQYLGGTEREIAAVKAGIVKRGGRCVVYRDVDGVIENACREADAEFIPLDLGAVRVRRRDITGTEFDAGGIEGLRTPLLGGHQPGNAALAATAALALRARGWALPDESIREGIGSVVWPGRFEVLRQSPAVVIDGGHNPQAVETTVRGLGEYFPGKPVTAVLGVMADKDVRGIVERLEGAVESFICVEPPAPRAMRAGELAELLTERADKAEAAGSVAEGVRLAVRRAGKDGVVCVLGSLYILEEARRALEGLC